jgi:hypothetical protein
MQNKEQGIKSPTSLIQYGVRQQGSALKINLSSNSEET